MQSNTASQPSTVMQRLEAFVDHDRFKNTILGVIVFNAILLGVETTEFGRGDYYPILSFLDKLCLGIFTIEIALKLLVKRVSFFKSGWNLFDLIIVAIAFMPNAGGLSVLRTLRIFRALRLLSAVPSMRRLVAALLTAIPGVSSAIGLLAVVFYVASVLATNLFAGAFPDWFGSLGKTLFTLFQVMTLESWSMGIARPVIDEYPYAWIFFILFILTTSFTMLNVFIGIIVDAMSSIKDEENAEAQEGQAQELQAKIDEMNAKLARIEKALNSNSKD